MSQAEDLLNSLIADSEVEEHIIIGNDRFIQVPQNLKKIAVQYDHNVRTVTFDCPRYSDGRDLSKMIISVNYLRPDGEPGLYTVKEIRIDETDETLMHFDWVIEDDVTAANGTLSFLICAKKTNSDGINENHWNTELNQEMTISKGLNCTESIIKRYPDLIAQILTRLDDVEVEVNAAKEEANAYADQNMTALLQYIQSIIRPYDIAWTDGGYVSKIDGSVNAEEGSSYSDFVKVEPGSKLIITNTMETDTDYNVFCDSSRNYVSSFSTNNGSVITTPENASYFRLSKKTNDTVTILPEISIKKPKATMISLPVSGWTGSGLLYSQTVSIPIVTANSQVELRPSPNQLEELLTTEISLTAVNESGTMIVFAIGGKPISDYVMQIIISEVVSV